MRLGITTSISVKSCTAPCSARAGPWSTSASPACIINERPMSEPILSPDVERPERLPPGQVLTRKWPVLHAGGVPRFDRAAWDFRVFGLVEREWSSNYDEFLALPRIQVRADMHGVTRWSKLDNLWEGVSTRELLVKAKPLPQAKFVVVHCEHSFTTNLPLADFLGDDCLFAWKHNGQNLEPD